MSDLDKAKMIVYKQPRRSRNLSDANVQAIATALMPHTQCNMGLNPEEVTAFKEMLKSDLTPEQKGILKRILSACDAAATTIGRTVLTVFIVFVIGVFTQGFWITLANKLAKMGAVK